jgi:hypothetical protein
MPDRKGQQFGPFVVTKNPDGEWQLDHWPTGFRLLPNTTLIHGATFGYNRLRRIASKLKASPTFRAITPENWANGTWPKAEARADLLAAINQTEPNS